MNLDTFIKYQQHLIEDSRKIPIIKNITKGTFFIVLRKVSKRSGIPFKWDVSNLKIK